MPIQAVLAAVLLRTAPSSAQVRLLPAPKTPLVAIGRAATNDNLFTVGGGPMDWSNEPMHVENAHIRRWRLPPNSLAADVVRLVARRQLVSQSDSSL